MARAKHTSCRWPTLKLPPASETRELRPLSKAVTAYSREGYPVVKAFVSRRTLSAQHVGGEKRELLFNIDHLVQLHKLQCAPEGCVLVLFKRVQIFTNRAAVL
jgi:hypothetical protein